MPTPTMNDPNAQMLSPEGLANQLFDVAAMQYKGAPREAAGHVIQFLLQSLFYAVTAAKNDVIVFLTETLIYVVSSSAPDEASRKEMLKSIGETIAGASPLPGKAAPAP